MKLGLLSGIWILLSGMIVEVRAQPTGRPLQPLTVSVAMSDAIAVCRTTTAGGSEGLEVARAFKPEVVLCDIGLPGMSGYEVAKELRADEALRAAHLVALTGYALPEDQQRASEVGFGWHIAKPPSPEQIEELLAELPRRVS